jgi:hypothetical protein
MHKLPIARVASLNPDFCSDFLLVLLWQFQISLIDMVYIRSLRNCSLEGPVPDASGIPQLGYLYVEFWTAYISFIWNTIWPICLGKNLTHNAYGNFAAILWPALIFAVFVFQGY